MQEEEEQGEKTTGAAEEKGQEEGGKAAGSSSQQRDGDDWSGEARGYLLYSTAERVVGFLKLPLDGNPTAAMGLIAHPGEVRVYPIFYQGRGTYTHLIG